MMNSIQCLLPIVVVCAVMNLSMSLDFIFIFVCCWFNYIPSVKSHHPGNTIFNGLLYQKNLQYPQGWSFVFRILLDYPETEVFRSSTFPLISGYTVAFASISLFIFTYSLIIPTFLSLRISEAWIFSFLDPPSKILSNSLNLNFSLSISRCIPGLTFVSFI